MNRSKESMRGTGRVGCAVWFVIFGVIVLVLYKIVPVKMRTSQFYDAMAEQAQFGSIKGDKSIQNELYTKAVELNLPLKKEDIHVHRDPSNVFIDVHYQILIQFPGYTYTWKEDQVVSRPLFAV